MRVFDVVLHNRIANDPSVRPFFGYHNGLTDLSPLLDVPETYVLLSNGKDAAAVMEWSAPGVWQTHTLFLPSCRGKRGVETGRAMLAWMFEREGARMIWGQTPIGNRRARMFNRLCGARSAGFGEEGTGVAVEYFTVEN